LYDEALGATLNGDLVRTAVLLRENEQLLLHSLPSGEANAELALLHAEAESARARLVAVIQQAQQSIEAELVRIRHGRRVLHGYTNQTYGIGGNVESRA
jgi:hypothetical protein